MSATIEIPTSNLETIVEPESAPDTPQSYEQGTDQTYDPKNERNHRNNNRENRC